MKFRNIQGSGRPSIAGEWKARYPWVNIPGAKMIVTAGIVNGGTAALEFLVMNSPPDEE